MQQLGSAEAKRMHEAILKSGWEALLFAVPFISMLLIGFLRLDEVVAAPKRPARPRRAECGQDEEGRAILTDPDGRRWERSRRRP
jgi:hypothetical protein